MQDQNQQDHNQNQTQTINVVSDACNDFDGSATQPVMKPTAGPAAKPANSFFDAVGNGERQQEHDNRQETRQEDATDNATDNAATVHHTRISISDDSRLCYSTHSHTNAHAHTQASTNAPVCGSDATRVQPHADNASDDATDDATDANDAEKREKEKREKEQEQEHEQETQTQKSPPAPMFRLPFERAFVINMSSATDRWLNVAREFQRIGVKPTRIEAVVGNELTQDERQSLCTPACAARCTPGMIGCGASHLLVWKRMLAENVGVSLVCEDDVVFVRGFYEKLVAFSKELPRDWDILYLSCVGCALKGSSKLILNLGGYTHASRDISKHIWIPPAALTTACYLVSASGARKLLAHLDGRLHTHIDVMMNALAGQKQINAYAIRPLLASQRLSALDNDSTASSIVTTKTPRGPTMLLNKFEFDEGLTWGYAAAAPFAKIGQFTFNLWATVFAAGGALCGILRSSIWAPLILCLLLLCLDVIPLLQGDTDTGVAIVVSCCLAIFGWLAGACLSEGASLFSSCALGSACVSGSGSVSAKL